MSIPTLIQHYGQQPPVTIKHRVLNFATNCDTCNRAMKTEDMRIIAWQSNGKIHVAFAVPCETCNEVSFGQFVINQDDTVNEEPSNWLTLLWRIITTRSKPQT